MQLLELAKLLLGEEDVEFLIAMAVYDMAQRTSAGLEIQIQAAVYAATDEAIKAEDTRITFFEKLSELVYETADVRAPQLMLVVGEFLPADHLDALMGEAMLLPDA